MAAYLYEGMVYSTLRSQGYLDPFYTNVASVEPNSLPGNTSFIAGFTQCGLTQFFSLIVVQPAFNSQRRGYESKYVSLFPFSLLYSNFSYAACRTLLD